MAAAVYRTIAASGRLFSQAPTGIGKTVSTLFPAVKAVGEGLVDRLFYLPAKTITPVSYTHLDVYKRQHCRREGFPL